MFGFYVILILAVLYIAFMGGVIGYLIGKYGKRCRHEEMNLLLLFTVKVFALLAQLDRAMVS